MLKDASFYIKRIKDLPSSLVEVIRDLYKEASSHRFICISMQELCEKLELEYTEKSFEKDCQKNYVCINTYLEMLGLKLVPCSIPVDLSFYDKIFVTPKPNLNNDEDCAAVRALIKEKRAPTQSDAVHISRMNNKLSNYNVMLRVFEGLFVVSSSKLDPHQRLAMNNILGELELPKEGLAYLRACYTYASEYRNRHCNYKETQYCFKPLNEELQKRVSRYLAVISASTSYREPLNQDYPYLDDLEQELKKIAHTQPARIANNTQIKPKIDVIESTTLENRFSTVRQSSYNYLYSFVKGRVEPNKTEDILSCVVDNSPVKDNKLVMTYFKAIEKYVTPNITKLIPNKDAITLHYFEDLKEKTTTRVAPCLYITDNKELCLTYPCMIYRNGKDLGLKVGMLDNAFAAYLFNSTLFPIGGRGNLDLVTVTSEKTNDAILFYTFFLRLILNNIFVSYDKDENIKALYELDEEYKSTEKKELLFIKGLYFALFECSKKRNGKLAVDEITAQALFEFPPLNHLAANVLLTNNEKLSIAELYEMAPVIFYNLVFEQLNEDEKISAVFKGIKPKTKHLSLYMQKLIHKEITNSNIEQFLYIGKEPIKDESQKLNNMMLFDSPAHGFSSNTCKPLWVLLGHPIFTNLFMPLFSHEAAVRLLKKEVIVDKSSHSKLRELICSKANVIKFLGNLENGNQTVLANLVAGNLTKLDEQLIKRQLKDFTFTKYSQLCDIFKIGYSYIANEAIEECLPTLGLMVVPIDSALPKVARNKLKYHKIISTHLGESAVDHDFLNKLCAAQMAFIIFSFIVPVSVAEVKLSRYMKLTAEQNVFAINFFNTLRVLMKGGKPFDEKFYRTLYAEQKNNKNFRLSLNYLKKLAVEEVKASPLKNYLENKFNEVFGYLSSRPNVQTDIAKEVTSKEKANTERTYTENSKEDKNVSNFERSSLVKTSDHSFFKATSFNLKKLDTSLIESKLKESAQIQDVISQIRNEDPEIEREDPENIEEINAKSSSQGYTENKDAPQKAPISEKSVDTATTNNDVNTSVDANLGGYQYPSESCKKLIDAIKSQNCDVIDLNEFTGICMSLKFMSRDAAIEEINDWAYDNFDDPLFDVAPEENCVYITTDILDKL